MYGFVFVHGFVFVLKNVSRVCSCLSHKAREVVLGLEWVGVCLCWSHVRGV